MPETASRVLVLGDYPGDGLNRLRRYCEVTWQREWLSDDEQLPELILGHDGLLTPLTQRVGVEVFERADRLRIVANCAVGVDNIDLDAAQQRGVVVTNTPDVLTEDTADLTWALILAVLRRVVSGDRLLRRGDYDGWRPRFHLGRSLTGLTLGVIGAGRIGRAVLARASAFGMHTRYYQRSSLPPEIEAGLGTERATLAELLSGSDVVSLHAALTPETHHLLDERALSSMRPGSYLINTARGQLVDEGALAQLLIDGHLGGAGLDVYEHEPRVHRDLLGLSKVVLLPHLGSATHETRIRMADCCFDDLITLLVEGRVPAGSIVGRTDSGGPSGPSD